MKRILEIINLASSAENFIGKQFSYFPQHGDYEMHLVCSDGPELEALVKKHQIKHQVIPINRNITPWQDLKSLIAICKYVRRNRIDVIICHQEKGNLLGQTAGFITRVPVRIVLSHGILYETMTGLKRWIVRLQDKLVSDMATNVICVSNYVEEQRNKDGVDKTGKAVVLGNGSCNGIDTVNKFNPQLVSLQKTEALKRQYGIKEDDFVIGFCGRLVRDKGVVELVYALSKLQKKHPEKSVKLFIIGEFEQRDALPEEVLRTIRESNSVVLSGRIPYADIQKYYTLMNVLVLPSHRDGLGLAPLEAQAMNVPAIVSKITGCRETIVEHETGEYVDLNSDSICEKLELFLDNEYAEQQGKKGRDFVVKNFDTDIVSNNLLNYLNKLTGQL
jgi:glycosyltransferase involved in cell wall biosynthesis